MYHITTIRTRSRAALSMKPANGARTLVTSSFIVLALMVILSACGGATTHATLSTSVAHTSLPAPVNCQGCWHPALKTSWQLQFQGAINPALHVNMYDVDMVDTPASVVASLHRAGSVVICYIDAGTWENWRPDASQFPGAVKGNSVGGWPTEKWLDIRQITVLGPMIRARLDLCKAKGFDGVDFDNVDGYTNTSGFPLAASDQANYNVFLANEAHTRGLAVGLKNDLDQIPTLVPYFDWVLDEQCFQYKECNTLLPFIQANKPVMEVEYNLKTSAFCRQANAMNFNSMRKHLSLNAYLSACR